MEADLPEINQRLKQVIDHYASGNVKKFATLLNENSEETKVSQQKLNRLFNIDARTNKYPSVPLSIITAVTRRFKSVDKSWLLSGAGKMLLKKQVELTDEPSVNVLNENKPYHRPEEDEGIKYRYIKLLERNNDILFPILQRLTVTLDKLNDKLDRDESKSKASSM